MALLSLEDGRALAAAERLLQAHRLARPAPPVPTPLPPTPAPAPAAEDAAAAAAVAAPVGAEAAPAAAAAAPAAPAPAPVPAAAAAASGAAGAPKIKIRLKGAPAGGPSASLASPAAAPHAPALAPAAARLPLALVNDDAPYERALSPEERVRAPFWAWGGWAQGSGATVLAGGRAHAACCSTARSDVRAPQLQRARRALVHACVLGQPWLQPLPVLCASTWRRQGAAAVHAPGP